MSEQRYHFRDILVAETPAPSTRALLHRELGQELVGLTEQVLRLDAPDDKLHEYIEHIRQLRTDLAQYGQRDYNGILQRLLAGEGSADDVTDLVDFEILTGKASPMSPPLELWLDGDRVRGRATFGLAFQGPPGRVHGGVLSLALDMLMAKSQDFVKQIGMTGTLWSPGNGASCAVKAVSGSMASRPSPPKASGFLPTAITLSSRSLPSYTVKVKS